MTCQVEVDVDGGDMGEFVSQSMPVACKAHKCCECGRVINPGEKYERVSGKWLGDFEVYKTCLDCLSIRDTLFCNFYYGCIFDELQEQISYSGGDRIAENLSGLTPAARARVCEMLEKHWAETSEVRQ